MERVSVVMCTYNGEKFIVEQLESILKQTCPLHEVIIQDDDSTDSTLEILERYAKSNPIIKVYRNHKRLGFNKNFFSAFSKATGDLIAVSDQDDIWYPTKLETQITSIGNNLLTVCRSKAFSDNIQWHFDPRPMNNNLIHFLYYSMPGHCMLFRKKLLDYLPSEPYNLGINYDSQLLMLASAHDSVSLINEVLVTHRRHTNAATFAIHDKRRTRSFNNGFFILRWSLRNYRRMQPLLQDLFSHRVRLLETTGVESIIMNDALRLAGYEGRGLMTLFPMMFLHLKYRHELFFTPSKGFINFCRAAAFCIMHIYNYRHLLLR